MNCPVCTDEKLTMTERSGVEIDYCPSCRGVWLDRGELDKIIERSAPVLTPPRNEDRFRQDVRAADRSYDDRSRDKDRYSAPKKRKRESFLGDLFDF